MIFNKKIFSKFYFKFLKKKFNFTLSNDVNNNFIVKTLNRLSLRRLTNDALYNYFFVTSSVFKNKKKTNLKLFKLQSLQNLTKKQKQRIKTSKAKKVIRPNTVTFMQYLSCPRNFLISNLFKDLNVLIHDGYSWHKTILTLSNENVKSGSLCFQTRSLSPISFFQKGSKNLNMKQKHTFKIKTLKTKRKK